MKNYKRVHDFYLEEGEEKLLEYILPEYYIDQNLDGNKVDAAYALRFLQNELNSVLNSFLNGGFSGKGYVVYPLIKDVSKENIIKVKRLKKVIYFLKDKGYDFSCSIKEFNGTINSRNFAAILSSVYQDFSLIKFDKNIPMKKPKCEEFELNDYKKSDAGYLKPLMDLKNYSNKHLKDYLAGFYLHGSFATNDYIKGWSDVDTLAVVSKETLNDAKALLKLRYKLYNMRRFFYRMEPLQHHGTIIITEYDINNYCQAYFPVQIFKYAKSFFPHDEEIIFKVRDYSVEATAKLFWFVNYFRKLNAEHRFNMGSYDSKILLHSVTLFPTLYLQASKIIVYKKFSFDIAKKYFKKSDWKVVDEASSIRSSWNNFRVMPLAGQFSRINPLLAYQLNSRISDLFNDIKKANRIDAEKISYNMLRLSEAAWDMVKKDAKKGKL